MTAERAREILGRLADGKSDQQIAEYVEALGRIAAIATRAAEREFGLSKTQDLLITNKRSYDLSRAYKYRFEYLNL